MIEKFVAFVPVPTGACIWLNLSKLTDWSYCFCLQYGPVEGVIFSDYGTDLGSGPTVPGRFSFGFFDFFFFIWFFPFCTSQEWLLS